MLQTMCVAAAGWNCSQSYVFIQSLSFLSLSCVLYLLVIRFFCHERVGLHSNTDKRTRSKSVMSAECRTDVLITVLSLRHLKVSFHECLVEYCHLWHAYVIVTDGSSLTSTCN